MRTRQLGGASTSVPVFGIGTWNMERDDRKRAVDAIPLPHPSGAGEVRHGTWVGQHVQVDPVHPHPQVSATLPCTSQASYQ